MKFILAWPATDINAKDAVALVSVLEVNTVLTALRLGYNPAVDRECQAALKQAAENCNAEFIDC